MYRLCVHHSVQPINQSVPACLMYICLPTYINMHLSISLSLSLSLSPYLSIYFFSSNISNYNISNPRKCIKEAISQYNLELSISSLIVEINRQLARFMSCI